MKSSKPSKLSKRMRQLSEQQVQEYVDRYYPEWGTVSVEISPCGTFASVRSTSNERTRRAEGTNGKVAR
jgi:hypothetical protein